MLIFIEVFSDVWFTKFWYFLYVLYFVLRSFEIINQYSYTVIIRNGYIKILYPSTKKQWDWLVWKISRTKFFTKWFAFKYFINCRFLNIKHKQVRDKKFSLRRGNINIISSLLESECSKHNLYTYSHDLEWLNVDGSLNESYIWLKRGMNSWQKKLWLFINLWSPIIIPQQDHTKT